jgi:hypothetical protein
MLGKRDSMTVCWTKEQNIDTYCEAYEDGSKQEPLRLGHGVSLSTGKASSQCEQAEQVGCRGGREGENAKGEMRRGS